MLIRVEIRSPQQACFSNSSYHFGNHHPHQLGLATRRLTLGIGFEPLPIPGTD